MGNYPNDPKNIHSTQCFVWVYYVLVQYCIPQNEHSKDNDWLGVQDIEKYASSNIKN